VDVGEHGQAGVFCDGAEDASAFLQAGTTEAADGSAVRFVVTRLEDVGELQIRRDALDGFGHFAGVGFGLDDAGAGDEEKSARACSNRSDGEGIRVSHGWGCTPPILGAKYRFYWT